LEQEKIYQKEKPKDWKDDLRVPSDEEHQVFLDNINQINKTNQMEEAVKKIRVEIDRYFTTLGQMQPSREISIAITCTQNGKMWLGQLLKALGTENPYPDSKNPINTNIAPTADTFDGDVKKDLEGIGHIQQVKIMRSRLSEGYKLIEEIQSKVKGGYNVEVENKEFELVLIALQKSWEYIVEANMWLGMELGRINNESTKK
jgi:hypothetical protein